MRSHPSLARAPASVARGGPTAAVRTIDIEVNGGYRPAHSIALAGTPVRLAFHRRDSEVCTERVVFSSPRMERRLAPGGTTVVDLPARTPGVVRFTCGMGRYRGEIEFVDQARHAISRDRRTWALMAIAGAMALLVAGGVLPIDTAAGLAALVVAVVAVFLASAWRVWRVVIRLRRGDAR